jgi:hypothetical protein
MSGPKGHIPLPNIVSGMTFLLCVEPPNEAVEKLIEGSVDAILGGRLPPP